MSPRHLHVAQPQPGFRSAASRKEIEAWAADRRKVLTELVEREGLGRQLTLERPAA